MKFDNTKALVVFLCLITFIVSQNLEVSIGWRNSGTKNVEPAPQPFVPEPLVVPIPPVPEPEQTFQDNVRELAGTIPAALRDRWAWCYRDAIERYSTDRKLREDVRLNSVQVLSDEQRESVTAIDSQLSPLVAAESETRSIKDVYADIASALAVNDWRPEPVKYDTTDRSGAVKQKLQTSRAVDCTSGVCRPAYSIRSGPLGIFTWR